MKIVHRWDGILRPGISYAHGELVLCVGPALLYMRRGAVEIRVKRRTRDPRIAGTWMEWNWEPLVSWSRRG